MASNGMSWAALKDDADRVRNGASEIHIEPLTDRIQVRYRIDGERVERDRIPLRMKNPLLARLKIMAGLNPLEKRQPQDAGRIQLTVDQANVDVRVSTLPTVHGESIFLQRPVTQALMALHVIFSTSHARGQQAMAGKH